MKLKYGFPPFGRIRKIVKDFAPDLIIVRERSVYSILSCLSLRNYKCSKILYNQSPLWEKEMKDDLPHRIVKSLLPSVRMTPVLGEREGGQCEPEAVYVPFVMEPHLSYEQKKWFADDVIHLFCVGKYDRRKNIHMLLEAFCKLQREFSLKLVVAGECSNEFQIKYKRELEEYVDFNELKEKVELRTNLSGHQMEEEYKRADLFVIPSTGEPASISQLEAMAYSVPVICSDTNGTACYVKDGKTGYLFQDNQMEELLKVMRRAVSDREGLMEMGKLSYEEIQKSCSYELYYQGICKCMDMASKKKERKK